MTRKDNDEQYQNVDWIARDDSGKVQRRTIVQGAAWTIPVIAGAAAAPLAAASNPQPCTNSRLEVVDASYIRDSSDGWGAEMLSNATGERLGIGWILPDSRLKANVSVRNPTNCDFTGTIRIQIDLPTRTVGGGPTSDQGFAHADGGNYTLGGLTYKRHYFSGTITVAARSNYMMGVNWTLGTLANISPYLGTPAAAQRTSTLPATSGSKGWRLPNPPGTININGANAHSGWNNRLSQNAGYWIHSSTAPVGT